MNFSEATPDLLPKENIAETVDGVVKQQPNQTELQTILDLYDQGKYLDAYQESLKYAPIEQWQGAEARLTAGRLALNWGAPRLGYALHWLAGRQYPSDPRCIYFSCFAYWSRFGHVHAWKKYRHVDPSGWEDREARTDWLALKALMLASFRDFDRADELIDEALKLGPTRAWLYVQKSTLLEMEDRRPEALDFARQALEHRPWYRPAVQSYGSNLIQLSKDEEALEFLSDAAARLQSGEVWAQLSFLQQEKKLFEEARYSINQTEKYWPLASRDSVNAQWFAATRCDLAYYTGDFEQAIILAKQAKTPFFDRIAEKLEQSTQSSKDTQDKRVQLEVPFVRQFHMTCAPATLAAIAQYWNKPISHEEVTQRICYDGTQSHDERLWATENGFWASEFRITEAVANQLIRKGIPLTLNTVEAGGAHLQAIVGFDELRGTFLIQDPSERHVREGAADKLLERYANVGPRGMVLLPFDEKGRLEGIELPEADLYDAQYEVDRLLAIHKRDEAVEAVKRLTDIAPDHRITLQARMSIARYDGNMAEGLSLTEKLLELFPDDANLLLMKLSYLSEFGRREQRLEMLSKICNGPENNPIFWTRWASELLDDAREHREAALHLKKAIRFRPTDSYTLRLLGNLEWSRGEIGEAVECYRFASCSSERDEDYARTYFSAARYLKQTEEALEWLRKRYHRFGDSRSFAGRTLGYVLEQLGRDQEATEILEETRTKHPEDGELLCYLALYHGRVHRMSKAEECLDSAKGKCPEPVYHRTKAALAHIRGDLADARNEYMKVSELDPLDSNTWSRIAELDADLEGVEAGIVRLKGAVERFPHSYSIRTLLIQWLRSFDLKQACQEVDAFLELHPSDAWGHREAAIMGLIGHDLDRATKHIHQAIQFDPRNEVGHSLLGQIFEEKGEIEQARQEYRRAVSLNVDDGTSIARLIATCDRPNDRSEQLRFVYEELQKQTTFGDGILAFYEAANGRMEPDLLLAKLEKAREQRPDLWHSYSTLVQQNLAMNRRGKAIEIAKTEVEKFPLLPRSWLDLAQAHRAAGDVDAQLTALEQARAINPHWSDVVMELTNLYMEREQLEEAENVLRQVLAADPREPGILASLANCLYTRDKKEEALQYVSKACSISPSYIWAWRKLAEWSQELDQGKLALETANSLIEKRPHDARGYVRLAELRNEVEDLHEGLRAIEVALRLDPRDIDAHELKAHYLGLLHQWDEALEACTPTVFGLELPVVLQMRRAYILFRKGLSDQAIDEMRKALKLDPDHYGAWSQLADWGEAVGRREVYKEAAENLVRIEPHLPIPRGYLADAYLEDPSTREEGKAQLLKAFELSSEYTYATARLIDIYLEDKNPEEAQKILDIGGKHLAAGYQESYQLKILAVKESKNDAGVFDSVVHLLEWCQKGPKENLPTFSALDSMPTQQSDVAIEALLNAIPSEADPDFMATALGRLLAREYDSAKLREVFKKMPKGNAWNACMKATLRSIPAHKRTVGILTNFTITFRKQILASTATWGALAQTYSDYSMSDEVIQATKDWKKRADATPTHLIAVLAARFERFRWKEGKAIVDHALKTPEDSNSHILHVWAGLIALAEGDGRKGLQHAQQVRVHELSGWYVLANRILVAGIECLLEEGPLDATTTKGMVQYFLPKNFPIEPAFKKDRVTIWFLNSIRAQVAKKYKQNLAYWSSSIQAWWQSFTRQQS